MTTKLIQLNFQDQFCQTKIYTLFRQHFSQQLDGLNSLAAFIALFANRLPKERFGNYDMRDIPIYEWLAPHTMILNVMLTKIFNIRAT